MNEIFKFLKKRWNVLVKIQSDITRGRMLILFNFALVLFQLLYLWSRARYINEVVPFWYTQLWGNAMLAPKNYLFLIPLTSLAILVIGVLFEFLFRVYFVRFLKEVTFAFVTLANILLTTSLLKIIFSVSTPFTPIINPLVFSLITPFAVAFVASSFLLPKFIEVMTQNDIVTNPAIHRHPGMLLQKPSARGGGVFYAFLFVLVSFIFIGLPSKFLGFFISLIMLGILGFVDDHQNTHAKSPFKALENPTLRLLLQASAVAVLVFSGVAIKIIGNPLGGVLDLNQLQFGLGSINITSISYVFTILWIVWVLNLLSWSNGIDGQYCGIIGIVSVFICILALRFSPLLPFHRQVAVMAAISAGVAFGFAKYTWYPSSIMWGFGATAAGVVVASLSIFINTKILVSVLILLVPFLDAVVTFIRRIIQKKNPLSGDRGHMHHLLLDMGWSVPQIAKLYWGTTFVFGMIGLLSSERHLLQTVLMVGGFVAFVIVIINLKSLKKQQQQY